MFQSSNLSAKQIAYATLKRHYISATVTQLSKCTSGLKFCLLSAKIEMNSLEEAASALPKKNHSCKSIIGNCCVARIKTESIWKAGRILCFKILLYVEIGVCVYVCVAAVRGICCQHFSQIIASIMLVFSFCLTSDLADKMCFCFRNDAQTPQTVLFDMWKSQHSSSQAVWRHFKWVIDLVIKLYPSCTTPFFPVQYVKWLGFFLGGG